MRPAPALAFASILLLAGCGGGGKEARGLEPPGAFSVAQGSFFNELVLGWTPSPTPGVEGYNLYGAAGSDAFSMINTAVIPADTSGGTLLLPATVPELTDLRFRIQSLKGTALSPFANAGFRLGIRPVGNLVVTIQYDVPSIRLSWFKDSQVADTVVLRKKSVEGSITRPFATLLSTSPDVTSFEDTDVKEGVTYGYEVYLAKGAEASKSIGYDGFYFNLAAPGQLAAATGPDSATLTWVNHSRLATELRVYRSLRFDGIDNGATPISVLPAGATSYTDSGLAQGIYTYAVASYNAARGEAERSPLVHAILQAPALDGLAFRSRLQSLPVASSYQLDAQGNWMAWPVRGVGQAGSLVTRTPAGDQSLALGTVAYTSLPGILMDNAFRPHLAYTVQPPEAVSTGDLNLVHTWQDDTGWHTETVASHGNYLEPNLTPGGGYPFLVAPDGSLHLLFEQIQTSTPVITEAVRSAAGWTLKADPRLYDFSGFAIAASGELLALKVVWVGAGQKQGLELWTRAGDGSWSGAPVPGVALGNLSDGSSLSLRTAPDGTVHLLAATPTGVVYLAQRAGLWSQPEAVCTDTRFPGDGIQLSLGDGGRRPFCAGNTAQGYTLFTRAQDGSWPGTLLVPAGDYPVYAWPGFDAAGKLYLVANITNMNNYYGIFTEP